MGMISALRRESAILWLGNLGSVGLRFILNVLIAQLAGAEQMGVYVVLSALTFIIGRITDLGLPNATVYFVRSERSATRRCVAICLIHSACMIPASIALLSAAAVFALVNPDSAAIIDQLWLSLSALITAQMLNALFSQFLVPLNGFKAYGLVMIISPLVTIAICILYGKGVEAAGVLHALLAGEACAAVAGLALVLTATPGNSNVVPLPKISAVYSYALKSYVGTSVKVLGQRADRLILSWVLPNSLLAAYAVAVALRDSALLPITTHAMVLRNRFIDLEKQKVNRLVINKYLARELIRWGIIATALGACLAATAPFVLPALYGESFVPAVRVFMVLSATLPFIAISNLCWMSLSSAGRPGEVSLGLIVSGVFNLVFLYVGAKMGGLLGACWGSVGAALIAMPWWLLASFRR